MKQRILILQDEKSDYDPIPRALGDGSYDLVWTRTSQEALRRAKDEGFDLLLLELDFADMESWRTLERFNALHPFLPVVVLSEWPEQVQRAAGNGADICLEKPVDERRLLQTIQKLLVESHQTRMSRLVGSLQSWLRVPEAPPGRATAVYEKNHFARG